MSGENDEKEHGKEPEFKFNKVTANFTAADLEEFAKLVAKSGGIVKVEEGGHELIFGKDV